MDYKVTSGLPLFNKPLVQAVLHKTNLMHLGHPNVTTDCLKPRLTPKTTFAVIIRTIDSNIARGNSSIYLKEFFKQVHSCGPTTALTATKQTSPHSKYNGQIIESCMNTLTHDQSPTKVCSDGSNPVCYVGSTSVLKPTMNRVKGF